MQVEEAYTANEADVRIRPSSVSCAPTISFRNVWFRRYAATFKDLCEAVWVGGVPQSTNKLLEYKLPHHVDRVTVNGTRVISESPAKNYKTC